MRSALGPLAATQLAFLELIGPLRCGLVMLHEFFQAALRPRLIGAKA